MATSIEETAVAEEGAKGVSRRGFLTGGGLIAGAAVMAGLAGCAPAGKGELASTGEAVPKAKGHVVHQQYICSGCRTCGLTCVLSHEQLINPQLARNKVETDVQQAYLTDVLYCQQCDDARCLAACPTGALHVDEATGARVIDQEQCVGCQTCLNACVFAPAASRIKYNPATNTCIKCDLCGGDPMCVKRCPLGASQLSWEEYTVVRPGIDDYVEKSTEGALEGVTFTKEYTGPHAGKAMDEQDWALVPADGGVQVKGQVTSSDGADLRVKMHCDFKDASGNVLGSSEEHMWCMSIHEHLPLEFSFAIDDPSQIAEVVLIGDISYWVKGVDEEY